MELNVIVFELSANFLVQEILDESYTFLHLCIYLYIYLYICLSAPISSCAWHQWHGRMAAKHITCNNIRFRVFGHYQVCSVGVIAIRWDCVTLALELFRSTNKQHPRKSGWTWRKLRIEGLRIGLTIMDILMFVVHSTDDLALPSNTYLADTLASSVIIQYIAVWLTVEHQDCGPILCWMPSLVPVYQIYGDNCQLVVFTVCSVLYGKFSHAFGNMQTIFFKRFEF